MTAHETQTLEDHIIKMTTRQAATYAWGLVIFIATLTGFYFALSGKMDTLADKLESARNENASLRTEMKGLSTKFDQAQQQSEIRYLELKLELAKKQDKR